MNKIIIIVFAVCGCLAVNAECTTRRERPHVANIQAKISAHRKYLRREANADKPTISVYSNVKAPEPAPVVVAAPVVAPVAAPAVETKVINIYGGTVVINN